MIRTLQNIPGVTFDDSKLDVFYAEDYNELADAVEALGGGVTLPTKATGAETNTGTDDAKFITPKALADSDYAKTSDIPSVPTKASGAEVNTGTDDAKFVTAKALVDSDYAKTSDIPATPTFISPRVASTTSASSLTPAVNTYDVFQYTALASALSISNPTGSPVEGQKLIFRIKDNATPRALTWDTQFRAMGTALPSTTTTSKTIYIGFIFNNTDTKWDCVAVAQEA